MENEQLPLETLLSHYEKGHALLKESQSLLESARKRIEIVKANTQKETKNTLASESSNTDDTLSEDDDDIRLL